MALRSIALVFISLANTAWCQYNTKEITIDASRYDEEFFSFHSRPDIEAPRWQSKVYNDTALAPGYWFVSPYGIVDQTTNGHAYVAPVIYDPKDGELVWHGGREVDYFNIFSLQVTRFNGQNMLSYLQPAESQGVIMNNFYAPIRHVRVGTSGVTGNMHDFQIVNDGTKALYLTNIKKKVSREQSHTFAYDGECEVIFVGIEERDVETDRITFQWDSQKHIPLRETHAYPVPDGFPQYNVTNMCWNGWGVDYIHGNSIEKLPDGDYLLSSRHMYAIYKISHHDGSIVWRLGGRSSDFQFTDGTHFSAQHDARCLFQNETHMTISVMDNAVGVWEDVGYRSNPNSRGLIMSLNLETMVATEVAHYDHPGGIGAYATERGNVQVLPGGNVFITWTNSAQHSEYTADGTLIAEAKFYTPLKTYRSFKYSWVGHRKQKPDVHSEVFAAADGKLHTVVRVSWNGDTTAAKWRVYRTDAAGANAELLETIQKTGFETSITYKEFVPYVKVDAVNGAGTLLENSRSDAIRTIFLPKADATGVMLPGVAATRTIKMPEVAATTIYMPAETTASGKQSLLSDNDAWDRLEDVPHKPAIGFIGGLGFAALLLFGFRMLRGPSVLQRMLQRRRRQPEFTALGDDDEKGRWSGDSGRFRDDSGDIGKNS